MGRKKRRLKRSALLVVVVICALLLPTMALPAAAATVIVQSGASIQDAIDAALPGTTIIVKPGTYHENLLIAKDGITLIGSGTGRTILEPPATPKPFCGASEAGESNEGGVNGICITDATFGPGSEPTINHTVTGVHLAGFTVRNFPGDGIIFFGTQDISTRFIESAHNTGYGIAAFVSSHESHIGNKTYGNTEAGIYVGDSPEARATVSSNTSYDNLGAGIFLRDASNGQVFGNNSFGNCIGIWILNTGGGTGAMNWSLTVNSVNANNKACPAGEEGLAFSGLGILITSGDHNTALGNSVFNNVPGGDTIASGGIVIFSDPAGASGTMNQIIANRARGNQPDDIFWDQRGNNLFLANRCITSKPMGLCH